MGLRFVIFSVLLWLTLSTSLSAQDTTVRIYVVGNGWHTGLVIPLSKVDAEICPGLQHFDGWEYVEMGWGDEGFYRAGDAIPLDVALAAVATPTPTVLHIVGVQTPVEEYFQNSELLYLDLEKKQFAEMMDFVDATFRSIDGAPVELGEGIYGFSRFFRAEGSYYFPNTCNVWTLKAIKAAGVPVIPAMGIRTENVLNQSAKFGTTIRRYPGRSRVAVFLGAVIAGLLVWRLRRVKRLVLWAWACLVLATVSIAAVTLMSVNAVNHPAWLPGAAAFTCWAAVAMVLFAHYSALRKGFRWKHFVATALALSLVLIGLSPL